MLPYKRDRIYFQSLNITYNFTWNFDLIKPELTESNNCLFPQLLVLLLERTRACETRNQTFQSANSTFGLKNS